MGFVERFSTWSIAAVNLPEHADNPVHTVEGGAAAGYAGAVVAGTTVFAYLTRPVAQAWGRAWLVGGGLEVWFRGPVLADEQVVVAGGPEGVTAMVDDRLCARLAPERVVDPPASPEGDRLDPMVVVLDDRWSGYAARAGEDLSLHEEEGLVHPAVWPSLANRVFATQLIDGAWVHTRSRIRHLGPAAPADTVVIESWEIDRFETRSGERAVVDIRMSIDGRPVCAVEHEAIVRLAG